MADFPEIQGYEITGELGEGGVAKVYLGFQQKLKRKVAIKVLHPHLLRDRRTVMRFENEAENVARLSHSNIVQIIDKGKTGDYHYIVMEYLQESLKDRVKLEPQRKMPPETALGIVEGIMKALDYAHLIGIYHRDIKPENIMFRQDNTPVLVDFGIARAFDTTDQMTRSGMNMGTVYYMSPEQCKAQQVDGRSDIYSLGVVLYEMLAGEKPYEGDSSVSVALQHIENPVPRLPRELSCYQTLIDKMMEKERENRPSSGPEFKQLLSRIIENHSPPPPKSEILHTHNVVKPHLSQQKTISANIILEKLKTAIESLVAKCHDLINEKLLPSVSNIRKKTKPLMLNVKRKLDLLKKMPAKTRVKILALGVITVILLIILFFPNSNNLKQKDEESYRLAVTQDTIEAYQKYIKEFPDGRHIDKAISKINELEELKKQKVKLRYNNENLTVDDVKSMVIQHHFFDSEIERVLQIYTWGFPLGIFNVDINPYTKGILKTIGTFKSYYEKIEKNGDSVVIDYTAGLMWHDGRSSDAMNIKNAERWIESLNIKEYGGYSDWRFPTVEEAASLLRRRVNKSTLHIDPVFSGYHESTWTKDTFSTKYNEDGEINMFWIVRFDSGEIQTSFSHIENRVWPVRSWEG